MPQTFFEQTFFDLLAEFGGTRFDKELQTHRDAQASLTTAYHLTKIWAEQVVARRFPGGKVAARRNPLNQPQHFYRYNWAKIYPSAIAPPALAYTVGINGEQQFTVKIDLVNSSAPEGMRARFDEIRGDYDASPIVANISADQGLALGWEGLLDWSIARIDAFRPSYDEIARALGLADTADDRAVLRHFDPLLDFEAVRTKWSPDAVRLFCRLARSVHDAGFDWWPTGAPTGQFRFGRKDLNRKKGYVLGGITFARTAPLVMWRAVGNLEASPDAMIDEDRVADFEVAEFDDIGPTHRYAMRPDKAAHWPTDFGIEVIEPNGVEEGASNADRIDAIRNVIYYGPPGTGKTRALQQQLETDYTDGDRKRYTFVTFHQSYGYEEFVEGLRPVLGGAIAGTDVGYEIRRGTFLELCDRARADPSSRYAIVIDEINRGNISKILGELITLIERDKREGLDEELSSTLAYSGKSFSVPSNVDVLASMNTADRSLALLDTALRRRFDFEEVMPDTSDREGAPLHDLVVEHDGQRIDVRRLLETINERIETLYDRDHVIGHAYFTRLGARGIDRFAALKKVFTQRVFPLLQEYFFDDWHKIHLVLGDNQKPSDQFRFFVNDGRERGVDALFGHGHKITPHSTRARYKLNLAALDRAESYVGIYAPQPRVVSPAA